jgi:hypothetical protein
MDRFRLEDYTETFVRIGSYASLFSNGKTPSNHEKDKISDLLKTIKAVPNELRPDYLNCCVCKLQKILAGLPARL